MNLEIMLLFLFVVKLCKRLVLDGLYYLDYRESFRFDIIFYYSSYKYLDVSFLIRLVFGIVRKIW